MSLYFPKSWAGREFVALVFTIFRLPVGWRGPGERIVKLEAGVTTEEDAVGSGVGPLMFQGPTRPGRENSAWLEFARTPTPSIGQGVADPIQNLSARRFAPARPRLKPTVLVLFFFLSHHWWAEIAESETKTAQGRARR